MKDSSDTRRKQKTSKEGWPAKKRVEPQGMQGVRSVTTASADGRNDGNEYASNLLESIIDRQNLNLAYKQVICVITLILTNRRIRNRTYGGVGGSAVNHRLLS
jgi:hypothetical protein